MTTKKTTKKSSKKSVLTAKPKTRVAFVLDASSSMGSIRNETIDAFNSQLNALKKHSETQDIRVSFFAFSDSVNPVFLDKPVAEVPLLEPKTYTPYGNTALYDAVGKAIMTLGGTEDANDPETAFLTIILTDGEENASRTYNSLTLSNLITLLQKAGRWTFTYTGANQDLTKVVERLNIPAANTMVFRSSSLGMGQTSFAMSNQLDAYTVSRGAGNLQSTNFYGQNGIANAQDLSQQATQTKDKK